MTEGRVTGVEQLGIDGVKSYLTEFADLPVEERLEVLVNKFVEPGQPLHDDLTILVLEARG